MLSSTLTNPKAFDEQRWLRCQEDRGQMLFGWIKQWLAAKSLSSPLGEKLETRLCVWDDDTVEGPATLALCVGESFGIAGDNLRRLGIAAHLFWSAADIADDVDDGEADKSGKHPLANEACAVLFLAIEAFTEMGEAPLSMAIQAGLTMAAGQALDLETTGRPSGVDPILIARQKAGAELALFFTLPALLKEMPTEPLARLGVAVGTAYQVFSDVADIYLRDISLDIVSAKHTKILQIFSNSAPLLSAERFATNRTWPDVQRRLRWEMRSAARESLESVREPIEQAWRQVAEYVPDPQPLGDLLGWLTGLLDVTAKALVDLEEPPPVQLPTVSTSISRALSFLKRGRFEERHTWGLFGKGCVTGNLFPEIFVAAALRSYNDDWEPRVKQILSLRDPDGWRYYPGQREIPADADDAGLILGYFGDVLPKKIVSETTAQLIENFTHGGIRTWLTGCTGNVEWEGDDCIATLSNAAWGLCSVGKGADIPRSVWDRLIEHAADETIQTPFYGSDAARYFIHRALSAANSLGLIETEVAAELRKRLTVGLSSNRRTGGTTAETVVSNAFDVLTASTCDLEIPASITTYFASTQQIDGSWPTEPLIMGPGVNYRPQRWGCAGLTTSLILLALSKNPA